jgi:hypothetical protein
MAADIEHDQIIAVSDGSYHDSFGTEAWILQGSTSRCTGQVICPGSAEDQNSYRSEVSGLVSVLLIVDLFVLFYQIKSGLIDIACDGKSALNKIFSSISRINSNNPCYDLLSTAQSLWKQSPLTWKTHHVKGHQDAHTTVEHLDIYSRLNVETDADARNFLQTARRTPRHFTTIGEPWSLWIDNQKNNI